MATASLHDDDPQTDRENLETFSLVWLDATIGNSKDSRNTEQQLRNIINHLRKFEDRHECEQYIEQRAQDERLVLIVSGELGQEIVPRIHHMRQVTSIYVYRTDKNRNERWTDQFTKVRVF
jgi:hypothetical protein